MCTVRNTLNVTFTLTTVYIRMFILLHECVVNIEETIIQTTSEMLHRVLDESPR